MRRVLSSRRWGPLAALVLVIALTFIFAACEGGGTPDRENQVSETAYKSIVITYNGRSLYCVERAGSTAYSGLSCDWYRFHNPGRS